MHPKKIAVGEKRVARFSISMSVDDLAELRKEAEKRWPATQSQIAYERYMRGLAAEKRSSYRKAVSRG